MTDPKPDNNIFQAQHQGQNHTLDIGDINHAISSNKQDAQKHESEQGPFTQRNQQKLTLENKICDINLEDKSHKQVQQMIEQELRNDTPPQKDQKIIKDQCVQEGRRNNRGALYGENFVTEQVVTAQKTDNYRKKRIQGMFARYQDQEGIRKKRTQQQANNPKQSGNQNSFKSKRKVRPQVPSNNIGCYDAQQRLGMIENTFRDCHSITKKNTKKISNNNFSYLTSWIQYQFFFSSYQRPYFQQNDYKQLIQALNFQSIQNLTFSDFKQIQKRMGKPKLLSSSFLNQQRIALQDIRSIARQFCKTQNISILNERLVNSNSNIYYERINQLKVGTSVLALASCGHLHVGTIFGEHKQNTLVVKFSCLDLGIQKIPDIFISSDYLISKQSQCKQNNQTLLQSKSNDLTQNVDHYSVSVLFKTLSIKGKLIQTLKQFNQQAAKLIEFGQQVTEQIKNNIITTANMLDSINIFAKSFLSSFRLRGVSAYRKQQIQKSFSKLLINPLNFMEKQLQANNQDADNVTIKQISQILQIQQENKVQQITNNLCENSNCQNVIFDTQEGKLVKNCLAILIGMKMQNRPTELVQNKYMRNISQIIYNHFGEQLNEITDCISAICSK